MQHNQLIDSFIDKITKKNLTPSLNLERPRYVQPEDRIKYRATRIIVILGMLNTKNGLSKEVIACMDFLLRNSGYQKKFIIQYFKEERSNLVQKLDQYQPGQTIEMDFNIVQYKSVPWDLRFNDMFLHLKIRGFVEFIGVKPNLRVILNDAGRQYFESLTEIFIDEINFLELFGRRLKEEITIEIITEVIPNSYWRENEKLNY